MLAVQRLEGFSVRAALAIGFAVTLGLWLYTGWEFTERIDRVRSDATDVAGRYNRAQELLSSVRAQVLLCSVRVRDALLAADPQEKRALREQVEAQYRTIVMALADYEPVMGSSDESERIDRLKREVDQFHTISLQVLANAQVGNLQSARDTLTRLIVPRREAALAISDEVQSLNRRAFIAQQEDIAEIHRLAEFQSWRRLGLALVVGLGVVLITSLYVGRLEGRLREQLQRDARISRELQQTAAKVLNAQEEERRRIARELHDEVGQVLTAIRVELDVAQRAIQSTGGDPAILSEAQQISDGALQTVRNLTQLLHPAALDDLGLPAAIDASLRTLQRRYNIHTELEHDDRASDLPKDVELAAYRIVQEGITNVAKHAGASRCDVRLTRLADRLLVEIEDDGVGFIEDTDRPIVARGLGLISMRERASRLGGTFNILSSPGGGTKLIVSLPDGGTLV